MAPELSLVRGEGRTAPAFTPPPLVLDPQSQRPGELAGRIAISLDTALAERLDGYARSCGLPLELLATISVEAERVLDELEANGIPRAQLVTSLDEAARDGGEPGLVPPSARALRRYAAALRSGDYRASERTCDRDRPFTVPDRLLARWSIAAQESGLTLEVWILARLEQSMPGREAWEACAAAEARTLAEWATVQALRRCA